MRDPKGVYNKSIENFISMIYSHTSNRKIIIRDTHVSFELFRAVFSFLKLNLSIQSGCNGSS